MISLEITGKPLAFSEGGLIPAIVQDDITQKVLMLGYMNQDALQITRTSGMVTFFSRSKNRIWQKGETSGNVLHVNAIRSDCDGDTLLIMANPKGPTCHTGKDTCWAESNSATAVAFLTKLEGIIRDRIEEDDPSSYTVRLVHEGLKKISQKVGEEGVETALEGVLGDDQKLTEEAADLLYHLIVLLRVRKLSLKDVVGVLAQRHGA